jgi:hypothetical protein
MAKSDSLLSIVRTILFQEWDPIGVNHCEQCRDEYDSYAPTVVRFLNSGADEHKLASLLSGFQSGSMGMSVVDLELHNRVARRLIDLVAES